MAVDSGGLVSMAVDPDGWYRCRSIPGTGTDGGRLRGSGSDRVRFGEAGSDRVRRRGASSGRGRGRVRGGRPVRRPDPWAARGATARRSRPGPVRLPGLGQRGVPGLREDLLRCADLGAQPGQQPLHPVELVAGHDRPAVRHRHQRQQRPGAAVDRVQVNVLGRGRAPRSTRRGCAAPSTCPLRGPCPRSAGGRRGPGRGPAAAGPAPRAGR